MKTEAMKKQVPFYEDRLIQAMITEYLKENEAARSFVEEWHQLGRPVVIDHVAIRCMDIDRRAEEFLGRGYVYRDELVEYPDQGWWAKVYRKPGHPALFVDQAYADRRGEKSILPNWVKLFGDRVLHHIAGLVEDIEEAVSLLQEKGVEFSGSIVGKRGTRLRQIFTASEIREGAPFTVLELTERNGYDGFYPEQADSLMQSSTKIRSK